MSATAVRSEAAAGAGAAAEEAVESGPTPLTRLEAFGVGAADIKKLQDSGLYTVESVAYATMKVGLWCSRAHLQSSAGIR